MDTNQKNQSEQNKELNIEISQEVAEGVYSNLVMVGHSNSEFIIDFMRMMPGIPKAKVKSRMILTPEHVVRLLNTLQDNISKYEKSFGTIKTQEPPQSHKIPMNLGGTIGEA